MAQTAMPKLTRIVLMSPQRRVDLSVPEYLPLVTLLPTLLRHAGNGLADEGVSHHGWVLRRLDGRVLDSSRSLSASGVVDGETLLLSPQDQHWPEPEYDDLAEAVGQEAKRLGAVWDGRHTRRAAGVATALFLLLGMVLVLQAGPNWTAAAVSALVTAVLAVAASALVARIWRDRGIALLFSVAGYAYAVVGSVLLVTNALRLDVATLLVGCATVVLTGVVSLLAVPVRREVHLGVVVAGLLGAVGAVLTTVQTPVAAAGCLAAALVLVSPWLPRIALYQAGMPAPTVPRPAAEVPEDEPFPPPDQIAVLVRRGDDILTGLLWGICATLVGTVVVVADPEDISARLLAVAVVLICALRARAFAAVRHRVPLLSAAIVAALALAVLTWSDVDVDDRVRAVAPVLALVLLAVAVAYASGRTYAHRQASPQLGRIGDLTEFVLIVISVIFAAELSGLFGYVRGLSG
ncbi:type VII secretion integral membrane protein EccD [Micromonospora sp. HM5-17]|jgi:type VII secretion integral membrane protein EccD|uniref:type VII secretion integral membrane protein EccD n=1 Tax=Micromonospora sp. HM5-17 TaxID=2487710 RepID=UPI000F4A1F09|nr:type VII secretion integral membrane protein EccD [Micromonospora sp. HM5-17]ROT33085.1 type VII secretion integral membrane protein EccD [Micromonospora sp. HM5-17]